MNTKTTKPESLKNLNQDKKISKTGYRALLLLTELIKSPMSKEEIIAHFQNDSFIGESLSIDSITNTINMLRNVGCKIQRPSQKTNYRYVLASHPFSSFLTEENINALQVIRESISSLGDWELLINLNNLYKKFSKYACTQDLKDKLLYDHCLNNINLNLLKELVSAISSQKQISLTYLSPEKKRENFEFVPQNITIESQKLYLWGYSLKYQDYSYLRIDRIKGINFIRLNKPKSSKKSSKKQKTEVVYKLKGLSAIMYLENQNEKIISNEQCDEYTLTINANIDNKFNFYQRLLSYGTDCKIVSPKRIIDEFKQELAKIKAVYINEQKS